MSQTYPCQSFPHYRGRFAPTPSGPLHFGSLLAALASWLDARAQGGEWLLRIEDIDTPRIRPGAVDTILRVLEAFGLVWDGSPSWQSGRTEHYAAAFQQLYTAGRLYPCRCSRKLLQSATRGVDGLIYPGTCRGRQAAVDTPCNWRFAVPAGNWRWHDRRRGDLYLDVAAELGDFALRRNDGIYSYQLAVVVDDAAQGITDVVRGADLLWSTPRQLALLAALGLTPPRYLHLPLATNAAGEKLSKQTLAPALDLEHAGSSLWHALEFLGQQPPLFLLGASPAELLAWAVPQWQVAAIPVQNRALRVGED